MSEKEEITKAIQIVEDLIAHNFETVESAYFMAKLDYLKQILEALEKGGS